MPKIAKPIGEDANELKDEAIDKDLSREIIKPDKPAKRFGGRWNEGFRSRDEIVRPLAPRGGGKAEAGRVYRPNDIAKIEIFRARGFAKVAGRHVMADGLVARSGRRRIFPDHANMRELEDRADVLLAIAKQVLRGRNATVFEGRVIDPLLGRPKRSVEELAAQFGVSPAKIHKITERCKERVSEAAERFAAPKNDGIKCPECGRIYAEWNFGQCTRGDDESPATSVGLTWYVDFRTVNYRDGRGIHPDCLPEPYLSEAVAMQKKYLSRFHP
jgi:hypothetical protein